MRWFKHMVSSADDEKLAKLIAAYGLEGYGFWWRIVETIAAKVEKDSQVYVEFPLTKWKNILGISQKKFRILAEFCEKIKLFELNFSENFENSKNFEKNVEIKIPNILKYRDEYSKKSGQTPERHRTNSGETPDKLRTNSGETRARFTEADTEIEEEEEKTLLSSSSLRSEEDNSNPPSGQDVQQKPPERQVVSQCPQCPHGKIIEAYHEILPELSRVKVWTGQREKHLAARWRDAFVRKKFEDQAQGIEYFSRYFRYVRDSPWLLGKKTSPSGTSFRCSLAWLVMPENYAKVIEGKYHDKAS